MGEAQWLMKSDIGPLYLVATERGLKGIFWTKQNVPLLTTLRSNQPQADVLSKAQVQLVEYFSGSRKRFTVPFDVTGTPFQKQVWNEISKVPYGDTTSYKEIAKRIRNARAIRAVGSANGKNPLCIFVPCHRIIASDGSLGGYSGGLDRKRKLLSLEKNFS